MAGTLYDYLQGGPTLSGFKQQGGSLSGVMPGALSQGYQRGMQLPPVQAGGTYGYTGGALGGQAGQAMPRSVATSLSPNLMQTFGVYGASQTPQQQAAEQATQRVPYYGLASQGSDAYTRDIIQKIQQQAGIGTTAEQQQIAANRQPGETAFDTAVRMQLSPQTLATSLLGAGLGGYSTLQGAEQFAQNPTLTGGLGTAGAGLKSLAALGSLAGLDPQMLAGLNLGGSLAGLGSTLTNPAVMGAFSVPQSALPSIEGLSPASGLTGSAPYLQAASGANIAGGALGVGGALNNLLGGDPRLGAALGLGGNLATTGGAMAAGSAGGLGTTLGIAGLPWAIGALISSFTSAAHQQKLKEKMGLAKESMATLKANMPQTQAALKALAAGDTSVLGYLTDQYQIAQRGRQGLGYVAKGPTTPFDKYSTQLFSAIQQANPAAYEQALRMGYGKQYAISDTGLSPHQRISGFRTGQDPAELIAKLPIEQIYALMGYGDKRQLVSQGFGAGKGMGNMFAGAEGTPGIQQPEWGYMPWATGWKQSNLWNPEQLAGLYASERMTPFQLNQPTALSTYQLQNMSPYDRARYLEGAGSSQFWPVGGGAAGAGGS